MDDIINDSEAMELVALLKACGYTPDDVRRAMTSMDQQIDTCQHAYQAIAALNPQVTP